MVSIIEGQIIRTWSYNNKGYNHIITLYHDPLTGVRSALLDYEEIVGSLGTSSIFMESIGHRILFSVKGTPGFIEIKRIGWFTFDYLCNVGGEKLHELTEKISDSPNQEVYDVKIAEHRSGSDGYSEDMITWYLVETTRVSDGLTNTVHRRFKDFDELNNDVCQHFRGHQLFSSIPLFPQKKMKLVTDHTDPAFLTLRESQLQIYLMNLIRIPHVTELTSVRSFLGIMDKVRETSLLFTSPTLGMTLLPSETSGSPAVIGFIQNPRTCPGLLPGDVVTKINGNPTSLLTFQGVVRMLKHLPRPIVVHFAQTLACPESESSREAKKRQTSWKGDLEPNRPHLPSFSADDSENTPLSTLLNSPSSQTQLQSRTISKSQQLKSNSRDGEYVSFT